MACDTFIVRSFLVPAIVTAGGASPALNWWPRRMPAVLLSPAEEKLALFAGFSDPADAVAAELFPEERGSSLSPLAARVSPRGNGRA